MKSLGLCAFGLVLVLTASACSSSDSTPIVNPAPATITETLSGTVPAPVNGVLQSSFVTFTVAQSGAVSLTLTSAVETLNGATNFAVTVGLAVGSVDSTGACILTAGVPPAPVQASPQPFTGVLNAGKACVQISGQAVQGGSVAYTLIVVHS